MADAASHRQQLDAWDAVAPGWDRHREIVWRSTEPVSRRMLDLLAARPGEHLLEVAAGPGETGLLAAEQVLPGGRLLSTDAIPAMVASARRRAEELGRTNVEFAVADATALGLGDATFDGALCRFGVMLVPDCEAAARELARVVRPGGRVVVAVWAEPEHNPWLTAARNAAHGLGLVEPLDPDAPGPFRLAAPGRLRAVLESAGLEVVVEEDVTTTWRADSLEEWWGVTRDTSNVVTQLARRIGEAELERVREAAAEQLAPYTDAAGALAVPSVARVARATVS